MQQISKGLLTFFKVTANITASSLRACEKKNDSVKWRSRTRVIICCSLIVRALSRTSLGECAIARVYARAYTCVCMYHILYIIYARTHKYSSSVGDSPFAEGKSTNGSISSTNTGTGARIPFRCGNAVGSCILEKKTTHTHTFITRDISKLRHGPRTNFSRTRSVSRCIWFFFFFFD